MAQRVAWTPLFALVLAVGLASGFAPRPALEGAPPAAATDRVVYLGGGLSDENVIVFTAALAASGQPGVVLLDSPKFSSQLCAFLKAFGPDKVIPVGSFPEGVAEVQYRLDVKTSPILPWKTGPPAELWRTLFPRADAVVLCPAEPRRLLLQAACLAGAVRAPLFVMHGRDGEGAELRRWLAEWHSRLVYVVGKTNVKQEGLRMTSLADEQAVAALYLKHQAGLGPIQTLVIANPTDVKNGWGSMSALAPWLALQKRAALVLTDADGEDVPQQVEAALADRRLRQADTLILSAGLKAIPMPRRPNPIPGDKDEFIEMEPLTPRGGEPFSFAIGRLFHDDPAVVLLQLARQRLLAEAGPTRKVLIASNPGGGLPLLETFSRCTAQEFRNAGYQTTARFGKEVTKQEVRRRLPEADIFLWEGHHSTLIKDYQMPEWDDPLPPAFVFLQSCLALTEAKTHPLLQRGAVAVVGSSTRTYSASGGACSLAFFDALLYEDRSLGAALRQAKNFLLAYSQLKEKRLGDDAKRSGANRRAAWAFTLWGDPTLKLPRPEPPADAKPHLRHEVRGNTIVVTLPPEPHAKVTTSSYQVEMRPNSRLAGLLRKGGDEDGQPLVPFVFAEVQLPKAPVGRTPRLRSKVPASHWVFCWDERRRTGYLLVTPRAKDEKELRFHVEWEVVESRGTGQ